MKASLSLLIALTVLGYGCTLFTAHHALAPCGPMLELVPPVPPRSARDDVGWPHGIAEGLRVQQRQWAAPCDQP